MTCPVDARSAYERLSEVTHLYEIRRRIYPVSDEPIEIDVLLDIRDHAKRLLDEVDRMITEVQGGPSLEAKLRMAIEAMAGAITAGIQRDTDAAVAAAMAAACPAPLVDAGATTRRQTQPLPPLAADEGSAGAVEPPVGADLPDPEPPASTTHASTAAVDDIFAVAATDEPPFPTLRPTRRTTDLTPDEEILSQPHPMTRPGSRPRPATSPAVDDELFGPG